MCSLWVYSRTDLVFRCPQVPFDMEPRQCPGVSMLKKEQLIYELKIRELSAEGTVAELVNRLLGGLKKPLSVDAARIGEVGAALGAAREAVTCFEETVEFLRSSQPTSKQISRVQAQLGHWDNRLGDLRQCKLNAEQELELVRLHSQVRELLIQVGGMSLDAVNLTSGDPEGTSPGVTDQGGQASDVRNDLSASLAKLPNPLMLLVQGIKELSIESLGQVEFVLKFIARFEVHADVLGVPHRTVIQFLYPLASGRLSRVFAEVLGEEGGLKELRKRIISLRLSPRMRVELERKHFWRAQGLRENLATYIESIREAVSALDLPYNEQQVVDNILEGMRPEDRSRLTFAKKPASFGELEALLATIEGFDFVDQGRADVHCNHVSGEALPEREEGEPLRQNEQRRCFRCNRQGHLARQCSIPKKQSHRS